jgi:L-amino acid N-acyltransferase YncA
MGNKIQIRPATIADSPGVARVQVDTWRSAYRGMVPDSYLDGLDYMESAARWGRGFSNPERRGFAFVAEDEDGEIVGFAVGGPQRSEVPGYEGELNAIYVLHNHQGKGTGRALARSVARELLARGMCSMVVWVLTDNHPARRFYESLGGVWLREGEFELDALILKETCYGWQDVSALAEELKGSG